VVQPPAADPAIGEQFTPEAPETPSQSPTPETADSTAPAAIVAPAEPPVIMKSEVQAVVAAATGSPLVVQLITVLILLGVGFAYFRFLGSKRARASIPAGN
jgi:hypothetical protein